GAREEWNRALLGLANVDPDTADHAEKELGKLIEKQLIAAIDAGGAYGPDGTTPTHADAKRIAGALASELRKAENARVRIRALGGGVDLLVNDLGRALARKLIFKRTEDEVRAEARKAGGLYPGEDVEVNERVGKPLAEAVGAERDRIEERLKASFYFEPNVKI